MTAHIVRNSRGISENETKRIIKTVIQTISFLHSNEVVHCDIKPGLCYTTNLFIITILLIAENVMLKQKGTLESANLKIIDFGHATWISCNEVYDDIS